MDEQQIDEIEASFRQDDGLVAVIHRRLVDGEPRRSATAHHASCPEVTLGWSEPEFKGKWEDKARQALTMAEANLAKLRGHK